MAKKNLDQAFTGDKYHLKYKICISGSAVTDGTTTVAVEKAEEIGRLVAERGMILVTGATTGIPYWAAKGAKEAGGLVFAQKFQTAKQPDMPHSAVQTGCVDWLLSPGDIAVQLERIGKERALIKNGKTGSPPTGRTRGALSRGQ